MDKFKVEINSEVLGKAVHEMTLPQIKKFNIGAYWLANKSIKSKERECDGMWAVTAL